MQTGKENAVLFMMCPVQITLAGICVDQCGYELSELTCLCTLLYGEEGVDQDRMAGVVNRLRPSGQLLPKWAFQLLQCSV